MTDNSPGNQFPKAAPGVRVIPYAQAPAEWQAEMERIMNPIDRTPESFDAVVSYGLAPLRKLGQVTIAQIDLQPVFGERIEALAEARQKFEEAIKAPAYVKAMQGFEKIGEARGGKQLSAADMQLVAETEGTLMEEMYTVLKLRDKLAAANGGVKELLQFMAQIGQTRLEATREIALHIGAGDEVLRRYDHEYIPYAEKEFAMAGDPEDKQLVKDLERRRDDFRDRIELLDAARVASVTACMQQRQVADKIEGERSQVQELIDGHHEKWMQLSIAAGFAKPRPSSPSPQP